ncbi:acyltransferase [Sphingomonas sp. DBB INV C78]
MLFHSTFLTGVPVFVSGFLAVDLFFLMSGFVLACAYDSRLAAGMSAPEFMRRRFARLLPMWIIGLSVGFAISLLLATRGSGGASGPLVSAYLAGLLFVPFPVPHSPYLFAFNLPGWSLAFELLANLIFACVARRLVGNWLIALLMVATATLVAAMIWSGGGDRGAEWSQAGIALARVTFGFFLGVFLYRTMAVATPRNAGVAGVATILLLTGAVLFFRPVQFPALYDVGLIVLFFPALIIAASRLKAAGKVAAMLDHLGAISYPLYAIHFPALMIGKAAWGHLFGWDRPLPMAFVAVLLAAILAVSWVLGRYIDPYFFGLLERKTRGLARFRPFQPVAVER